MVLFAYAGHIEALVLNWDCFITSSKLFVVALIQEPNHHDFKILWWDALFFQVLSSPSYLRCHGKQTEKLTDAQYLKFRTACAWPSLCFPSSRQTTWRLIPSIGSGPTVSRAHAPRIWPPSWGKLWRRVTRWPSASWCGTTHAISLAQGIIPLLCR